MSFKCCALGLQMPQQLFNPNNSIYKAIVNGYELDEMFSNPQYIRNFGGKWLVIVPNIRSIRDHI